MSRKTDSEILPLVDAADENPSDNDDLTAALSAVAARQWWNRTTVALTALTLAVGGFFGGATVQKYWGADPTGGAPANLPAGRGLPGQNGTFPAGGAFPAGGSVPGAPSAAATAPAGTTGKIKLVDGTTVYVQTADGTIVTVRTTKTTDVRSARRSKLTDLKAGDAVTVQGAADGQGTVTATAVTAQAR